MGADRDTDPADPVAEMFVARGLQPVEPEHRHVNLMLADILAKGIRDAAEVNRAALQAQRFPLDAEQIVRLTASVFAEFLDATRPRSAPVVNEERLVRRFASAVGLNLEEDVGPGGYRTVQPYPASKPPGPAFQDEAEPDAYRRPAAPEGRPTPSSSQQDRG